MPSITIGQENSRDIELYYKDWGSGQPVVFSHGWPLSADAWEDQMVFLASHGYRCIAHDRRGHGRSSQPWNGNDMDTYADDLAKLVETLNLQNAIHVGHSTGGGEVARYIGRHGTTRVAKAVLISAVPPLMLKTTANPGGLPMEVFDEYPYQCPRRPLTVLQGSQRAVLWGQPAGRQGLAGSAGLVLVARDAGWFQRRHRLHQGLFRDGSDRRSQEVRRADAHHPRRRRPDRADWRLGPALVQDHPGCHAEGLQRRPAWHMLDPQARGQRGFARVPQVVSDQTSWNHFFVSGSGEVACRKNGWALERVSAVPRHPFGTLVTRGTRQQPAFR